MTGDDGTFKARAVWRYDYKKVLGVRTSLRLEVTINTKPGGKRGQGWTGHRGKVQRSEGAKTI